MKLIRRIRGISKNRQFIVYRLQHSTYRNIPVEISQICKVLSHDEVARNLSLLEKQQLETILL